MEPSKMTLEQLGQGQLGLGLVDYFNKEEEKLIKRISELEAQVKWTRFDPNDPKTFPPMYESVLFLVYWKHFDPSMKIGFYNNVEFQDEMGHYIRAFSKILWRPLPKPPVETEEQK